MPGNYVNKCPHTLFSNKLVSIASISLFALTHPLVCGSDNKKARLISDN
jgi:hypothetical protein